MQSRLQDLVVPGVVTLLNDIDTTMNSNTMLLKVLADTPLTPQNCQQVVTDFLRSSLCIDMMLELDQQRNWYNYARFDGTSSPIIAKQSPGTFVKERFQLVFTSMTQNDFAERLHWMLRTAFRPYNTHVSEEHAQNTIGGFFREIFAPESWPFTTIAAQRYWNITPWSFSAIKPDFLETTDYFGTSENKNDCALAYFDGGSNDSCTFFYQTDIFYLLLTNGSP